jgi:hypothetical protein
VERGRPVAGLGGQEVAGLIPARDEPLLGPGGTSNRVISTTGPPCASIRSSSAAPGPRQQQHLVDHHQAGQAPSQARPPGSIERGHTRSEATHTQDHTARWCQLQGRVDATSAPRPPPPAAGGRCQAARVNRPAEPGTNGPWPWPARMRCSPGRPADTRHARPNWQWIRMSWLDPTGRSRQGRDGGDTIDMPPELPGGPP